MSGGSIQLSDYISSNNTVQFSWSDFESDVGMFLYYAALSSAPVDNSSCQVFVSICQSKKFDSEVNPLLIIFLFFSLNYICCFDLPLSMHFYVTSVCLRVWVK